MSKELVPYDNNQVFTGLHPLVYVAMAALAGLFVISAWIGFGGPEITDYVLVVMTGFIAMAVGLPLVAASAWRRHRVWKPASTEEFVDWIDGDFETRQGRMTARTAMAEILLPLSAVAFGMMAFAILAITLE